MLLKKCSIVIAAFFLLGSLILYGQNSQTSDYLFQQGVEAIKSSNFGSAELIFRKIIDRKDEFEERSSFYLAFSLLKQNKYDAAIFEFNRFLLLSRTQNLVEQSQFYIAEAHYLKNDYIKAIEDYKKFLLQSKTADNQMKFSAYDRIASIYFRQERYDEAVIEWKNSLSFAPKDLELTQKLKIANSYYKNGKYDDALEFLEPVASATSDPMVSAQVNLTLGLIYQNTDRDKIALRYFSRIPDIIAGKDQFINVYYYRGLSAYKLNMFDDAAKDMNSYISLGEKREFYYDAQFVLAMISLPVNSSESKQLLESIYLKAVNADLKKRTAVALADIYISNGDYAQAVSYLENAVTFENNVKNPNLQFKLAEAYLYTHRYDDMIRICSIMENIYRYESDIDKVYFYMAVAYTWKNEPVKAAEYMAKVDEVNPFSPYKDEMKFYLAVYEFEQGNFQKSKTNFREYLKKKQPEKKSESLTYLYSIAEKQKNAAEAGEIVNQFIGSAPRSYDTGKVVISYLQSFQDQIKNTAVYENFVLRNFPSTELAADINRLRGNRYFKQNDYRRAEQSFTEFLRISGNDRDITVFNKKAECLFYQKKYNDVILFLTSEKLARYDETVTTNLVKLLTQSYFKTGDLEKAYSTLKIISVKLKDYNYRYLLFDLSVRLNDYLNAQTYIDGLVGTSFYPEALYRLGVLSISFGNIPQAKTYFDSAILENDPLYRDRAYLESARISIDAQDYLSARADLEKIKEKSVIDEKNLLIAKTFFKTDEGEAAIKVLGSDLRRYNSSILFPEIINLAFDYAFSRSDLSLMKTYGNYLARIDSASSTKVSFSFGVLYFNQGNTKEALIYLRKVKNYEKQSYVDYMICRLNSSVRNYYAVITGVAEMKKSYPETDLYLQMAQIELALVYLDKSQIDNARPILQDLGANSTYPEIAQQARKILEFGVYDKE